MATPSASPAQITLKSPSGQFSDMTLSADLAWTVRRLKECIGREHPAHPACDEQKLVYLGRLLQDHNSLKAVLRQSEQQADWTVHLVLHERCLQRSLSAPNPATATAPASPAGHASPPGTSPLTRGVSVPSPAQYDGLRRRIQMQGLHNAPSPPGSPAAPLSSWPASTVAAYNNSNAMFRYAPSSGYATPQGTPPPGAYSAHPSNPYYYYYYPYAASGYTPEMAAQAQAYSHYIQSVQNTPPTSPGPLAPGAAAAAADLGNGLNGPDAAAAAAAAAAPAPGAAAEPHRFAQAGVGAAPMVDNVAMINNQGFNVASALMLIGKLVLFVWMFGQHTDSTRFAIICCVAVIIFLHQLGLFRTLYAFFAPPQRTPAPNPNPAGAQPDAAGGAPRGGDGGEADAADADAGNNTPDAGVDAAPAPPPPRPTLFGEVRNVIVGFVWSLVPNQHEVVVEH